MEGFARGVVYLNLGAALALLVRLKFLRLTAVYRCLTVYLLAYAGEFLITAALPLRSTLYGYIYMLAESANLILSIFVVLELIDLSLAAHPALAVFGRKTVVYAMGLAVIMAAGGVMLDSTVLPGQSKFLHRFLTVERSMDLAILIFLLLISGFLIWFPVKVRRNIVLYISGFVVFYLSRTFGLLMINLLPPNLLDVVNNTLICFSFGFLIGWLLGLRRESEDITTTVGHRWNRAAVERLSGQLDTINATLLRFGRR